ncbi:hypothetical protein GCM10010302_23790 [Streptomyces polychromogenes]|uniref:Uncharacterized protein n=1 Tax=Streptomyces polychromogenes TaxID=67342 RepID=A0ABN0VBF9_9ACTN
MYENAQERPPAPGPPSPAGITDGVVELRKRRPNAPAAEGEQRRGPDAGGGQDA